MESKKCSHEPCSCPAMTDMDYCCDTCRVADARERSGDEPMARCNCEHPDCGGADVPIDSQSLLMASEALAQA